MNYICTTPDCAIALSNASFPIEMNCPVCQKLLQAAHSNSTISQEDQQLIASLPYVISYPLKRALEEKHAWTKINLLKDTFLNYLKYLGLLTASEFFNSDLKNRRMVDAFQKNLAQPSFGSWNAFIRECIAFLKEQNHVFFYPELVEYYEKIETGKKRKIYKGEIEYIDSNGDVQLKKQETTAIGLLINFRNRYLGHGLTLDEQASNQLWNEYFPVFKSILEQMSFSREYPMYKREHGETYLLQGAELKEINTTNILDGSIWLENKKREAFEILPFYIVPGALALAKEDKEQVLSYESYTGKTIKFFSPEGSEKQTSGIILEKLNLLLRNKQKETAYSPETFSKEVFLTRILEENKLVLDTLIQEKKVIEGIYQHRETIEIKLREWIGARANIFFIAAEAGSGKTNLLVEIQKQYTERQLPSLFIRAARMEKSSLKEQIAYQLNLDATIELKEYKNISGTQAEPTFILIDGLNEVSNAEAIWSEILEISTLFEPGSLKFVLTNRANSKADLERYELSDEHEQFIYNESKEREREKGIASHVFWLTPLDMKEMEGAWDVYVKKDKARFKPLFSFNDLAKFDRALYLQINNPLVLRLFLETYQGKNLPKETKHLHIWKDWFATFSENEQQFMLAFADAIWEKGENEIELEELLNNQQLKAFILTDNISGPYHRLLNLGWVSRYHKDLTIYISFTVEGLLLYLFGLKLDEQQPKLTVESIEQILNDGTKLQKAGVESFLCEQSLKGKIDLITDLIDAGEEKLNLSITPLLYFLKSQGVEKTIEKLLKNPTENDWIIIYNLEMKLYDLQHLKLRSKILQQTLKYNSFGSKIEIQVALSALFEINESEKKKEINEKIINSLKLFLFDKDILLDYSCFLYYINDFKKSIYFSKKSLVLFRKDKNKYSEQIDTLLNNIIESYYELFDLKSAKKYLDFRIKLNSSNKKYDYLHFLNRSIGIYYSKIGEYLDSTKYYELSLDYSFKNFGYFHLNTAIILSNIGLNYHYSDNYELALKYYNKSLEIHKFYNSNFDEESIYLLNNIGGLYADMKDYKKALEIHQECLRMSKLKWGINNLDYANVLNNIGVVYWDLDDYNKSIQYYNSALKIRKKILGKKHELIGNSYNNIANSYLSLNQFDKAIFYLNKSIKIRKEIDGNLELSKTFEDLSYTFLLKANYEFKLKKYEFAIKNFQKGYNISRKGGFPFKIAECYEALNDKENALDYYIQSAEIRKDDPEVGLEAEATQESISNALRLAKELGKEVELPEWIKLIINKK